MRAFVYEAYIQAGGTYMAYHLGRLLHTRFGIETQAVGAPQQGFFSYPDAYPAIDQEAFLKTVAPDDLFICNPSFSGELFGLRLPCRKLCYVQGVRTYTVLDVFYDRYVFVSRFARDFVSAAYGIDGPVIPAFIHTDRFRATRPWEARRPVFLVTRRKHDERVFERLRQVIASRHPGCGFEFEVLDYMPQEQLARRFQDARYYLSLDAMEGFGLPMLEAMASGCIAVGWDSGGCREYARDGENTLIARYGDFERLAGHIDTVLKDAAKAQRLAQAGAATARCFDQAAFDAAWSAELQAAFGLREA